MKCPTCKDANLLMSDRSGVEIDYCAVCRGVWLDRGELDKIIERSTAAEAPQQPMQQQEQPRHSNQGFQQGGFQQGYHRSGKRKKSILSELFDF